MEIGKVRTCAGAKDEGTGMLTPNDARRLGLEPIPEPIACQYCGKPLVRLGINVGGRMLWVSHVPCGCPGEQQAADEEAAREVSRAEEARRARVARAGVGRRYYDAVLTHSSCIAFVDSYAPRRGFGLYIYGPIGTGKTYNASAVSSALAMQGRRVVMTSALRILSDVKDTFDTGESAKRELERYMNCEILVLDDLGKESSSRWSVMTLFDIVNTRYESMLSTIYTSQYSLPALQERLSSAHETETAKAIVSRIRETCLEVRLFGDDMRTGSLWDQMLKAQALNGLSASELGRFSDVDTVG